MRAKNLLWLFLSLLVFGLDQFTKYLARQKLLWGKAAVITKYINLTLLANTGAAFSFLQKAGGWQRWFFAGIAIVVCIVILIWMLKLPKKFYWRAASLALILGGSLGNLYDRLTLGYVIDFLQVHLGQYFWPVFNVADSAICLGAFILIVSLLFGKRQYH